MGHRPLIAVIDDDASARGAARSLIGSLGFAAVAFDSAEAFLASPIVNDVACLLVDLRMTHMTGNTPDLRSTAAGRTIPMIVTTRLMHATTRRWTRQAGIVACLEKPLEPESLTQALVAALGTAGAP